MTDANWNDKQGESGEKAHKVLKSSVRKNWCKLYAISSLINKDWKLQRFDLHFKTVKGVLGCLITRSKAHTFTWCIALEFSSFFVWICSKHSKWNSVSNLRWTEDQLCYHSHHKAEKQHCCMLWSSQQKCYYLLTLDLDQVCTDGWSCRESNEQIHYCWRRSWQLRHRSP